MSTVHMDFTHFCSAGEALKYFLSCIANEFLQREAINHNHIVTNDCAVVTVTVINRARGEGLPC